MQFRDREVDILDRIARIQQQNPDLIRPELDVHEDKGSQDPFVRVLTQRHIIVQWKTGILTEIIGGGKWIEQVLEKLN